jgi:hypothetical protein
LPNDFWIAIEAERPQGIVGGVRRKNLPKPEKLPFEIAGWLCALQQGSPMNQEQERAGS